MAIIVLLTTLIAISVLSPFWGVDTKQVELQGRRWGFLR